MNRQAYTDRMEACAQAAQDNARLVGELGKQAAELAKDPENTAAVASLDLAAGMVGASVSLLLQTLSHWAGMRGEFNTTPLTTKDRELANGGDAKVEEPSVA